MKPHFGTEEAHTSVVVVVIGDLVLHINAAMRLITVGMYLRWRR
jgi:hypothetical protein